MRRLPVRHTRWPVRLDVPCMFSFERNKALFRLDLKRIYTMSCTTSSYTEDEKAAVTALFYLQTDAIQKVEAADEARREFNRKQKKPHRYDRILLYMEQVETLNSRFRKAKIRHDHMINEIERKMQ